MLNKNNKKSEKLFKLASNKEIVSLVAKYLGMLPSITFSAYWYTPFLDKPSQGSQLLHLDHEEFKQLKMFIYCSDVKLENGPMHIINKMDSKVIQKKTNYTTAAENKRISDESVNTYKIQNFSGPKKRIFVVDTSSCFHFGGRVTSGDRLVGIVQYLTPLNYNYINLKKKLPLINNKKLIDKNKELFIF